MEIIDKAKDLGKLIVESEQFKNYKKAEVILENDELAQALIAAYNLKRTDFAKIIAEKKLGREEAKKYTDELEKEYEILLQNQFIKEFIDAKNEFESLYNNVMEVISYFVQGETSEGCRGNCSSCGGCH